MDEELLKTKAQELAELIFETRGADKQAVIEFFTLHCQEQVRMFFQENGRWPTFRKEKESVVLE